VAFFPAKPQTRILVGLEFSRSVDPKNRRRESSLVAQDFNGGRPSQGAKITKTGVVDLKKALPKDVIIAVSKELKPR
jgi:hypothetical protein